MYLECLCTWHCIMLQPITHVHVCSSHIYLLSDNTLSLIKPSQGIVKMIYIRNGNLKWQHTGAICTIWVPFVYFFLMYLTIQILTEEIACLNSLSVLKELCKKWSNLSFRSRRLCWGKNRKFKLIKAVTCIIKRSPCLSGLFTNTPIHWQNNEWETERVRNSRNNVAK